MVNVNEAYPSKYVSSADLNGSEPTLTIRDCIMEKLGDETKPILYFEGHQKGMALNKTNAMTLAGLYGPESDDWKGAKVTLFVIWTEYQGRQTQGLRLRAPAQAPNGGPAHNPQANTAPAQQPVQQEAPPQAQPDFSKDLNDSVPF